MRNKLLFALAKNPSLSSRNINGLGSKLHRKNFLSKTFVFVVTFIIMMLISNKGFAQLNENFDSGIPATWTIFGNGVGSSNWGTTTDGYLGTNGTSVNPSADNIGDQNTARYFLVTPQILVPENGEIHFFTKQSSEINNGATYEIRLSNAAQPDINGFNILLQTYTEANLNIGSQTAYEEKVIELPTSIPTGFPIYIAFVAVNTQNGATPTGDEWFVDNVSVLEGCVEVDDDDVSIDDITVNSAEVTWSHPTATNFEIQVLPTGGIPAASGIPVTGTSYSLINLDPDTEFDVYIAAICDNNTQSQFAGPYTFETLKYGLSCDFPIEIPDISSTPYILQDNLANWVNPDITYTTQGSNCVSGASTTNYLRGDKIFLTYTPTQSGLVTLTQTTFTGGDSTNNCYNARSSLFVYDSCADVGVSCIAGVVTLNGFQPKTISNLLVQADQTYVIVVSSELSSGAGICFELEISSPTCAPPGEIVYNSLTEDSVVLSWDNIGGFADAWEYVVVPTGSGEPTGSGIATNTNVGNLINTGLSPDTTYDIYVRSVCSGSPGVWSAPSTFRTQCSTFNLPYSTDFANATNTNPEPCWTTLDVNGDDVTWAFIGGYATVQTQTSLHNNYDIYASPRVFFDGTPKRIRYKHRSTQGASTYTVKLSTTGVGVDDFTTVVLPTTTINNTTFQEIIVDLPENISGEVNIAWIVEPNATETALRLSIDDVVIEDKPTCPDPLNPFVLNITTTSAWLFWTAGDSETQWQVVIQDEGTGIPTGDGVLVSSNFPYMATDLTPGRRYEFYVRAYCDTEDQSEWIGPVAFTTLCTSYDTPFYESFNDDDADTQKFCWSIVDANNDGTLWNIDETHAVLQTAPFAPASSYNDYLISPAITLDGTTKVLKYKYRALFSFFTGPPRYGLEVLMSTTNTNPSSFQVISPLEVFTNTEYIEKSIILEGTGTVYFAFRVPPALTGGVSILNIDDVSITDAPSCPNPSDLVVTTTLTNGADLTWTAGYQETAWNVVVQPAGSGIPTGSGVNVTTNSYSPTDLMPNTEYEFYVMADCGSDDSDWVGPVTFRTLCTPFTSPFVETFNTDSTSESCWRVVNDNGDLETWELNSAAFPYEGDQAAAMFTGTNGNNEDWLISPTITITENQRLRYYYRVFDSFFTEDLEVLLSTNGTGLDQFTTVLYDSDDDPVLINNVEYKVKIINIPDGISGDINIAFHVPFFPSTGPYRGQTLVIDNVNIEDVPECAEPTNITLNNLTDTQVQVGWDANGSETAWEISVQPSGTPAPVGDTDPSYLYNATTNPFTVTGLNPSTMYDIYVRAVCDGTTEGIWTGPKEVTSKCSFENLCQYTFVLYSDSDISATLDVSQNNQLVQELPFGGEVDGEEFTVFLCSGVQFSLYFSTIGSFAPQYANYHFDILNDQGQLVYASPTNLLPRRILYTGTSVCGAISCPQPTDLTVSATSVFSWTPGGSETQWEVAVQPIGNGTIPQSGTIVSSNSYTPTASDFNDPYAATYEYFVRAICGTDDESYWSGPYEFVRNDDVSTALTLPINSNNVCNESGTEVSFIGATASAETMTCDGINGGDVWFDFTATSVVHVIELNSFSGDYREDNGFPPYSDLTMTLYKNNSGTLEEIACGYDNVILAMYTSELIVGQNYKLRLTLNSQESDSYRFNVCVKTPEDLCSFNVAINGGFEEPVLGGLSGVNTIIDLNVMPGWRSNLDSSNSIFLWESLNAPGFSPYEGGQFVQVLSDQGTVVDPNDPNVKGLYRDFDTSEVTLFEYSFAHYARFDGNNIELLAGPPGGPYILVNSHLGEAAWQIVSGTYEVPNGQTDTRFIFRANGSDDIGNALDAVSFVSNNEIITAPYTVDCTDATATLEANGAGTWLQSDSNPGVVTFDDANDSTTTVTGFAQPGIYTFTWKTRYCENTIDITYNGIADIPTVETPVEYCLNATAQPLTATASGTYTLLWYTQAVGGTGSTTAPTPDTSVAGNTSYFAAYVDTLGCEGPRAEIVVNVNDAITPELTFSYPTSCETGTENISPTLSDGFATGGVFTSTTLTVDPTTGEIDITSAAAGQHQVLYTYDGDADNCILAGTYTATVNFTVAAAPITMFDYGTEPYCLLTANLVTPNLASGFTAGGVFTSDTVTVDATTGAVDITSATAGPHNITYSVDANGTTCTLAGTFTTTIEVIAFTTPITDFVYVDNVYCADSANVVPELATGFTTGGTFSAESGLSINATTGEINISGSTLGNYTVTYQIAEDISTCTEGSTSTYDITILDAIEVTITGDCDDSDFVLTASPVNNSFNPNEVTYTWMNSNGTVVGNDSEVFNVTQYAEQNQNITVPMQFTVTIDYGSCSTTAAFTVERLACKEIPRGISPGNDGKNDSLDLTGYGVVDINIFNRYGTEVYTFKGAYSNQWYGQSNKGNDLPDGTYFYHIRKQDGSEVTGWIYINREK